MSVDFSYERYDHQGPEQWCKASTDAFHLY
jgi:hypothetical protein